MTKKGPEAKVQQDVLNWLTLQPRSQLFAWRNYTGPVVRGNPKEGKTFFTPNPCPGAPDIEIILNGRYIGLECKSSKGVQCEAQKTFEHEVKRNGGFYFIIRSLKDAMDVVKQVQEITCIKDD